MENENDIYKATVIGSGPSGIAIIGQLISRNIFPILWIDPNFDGGKMSSYRKVPANTRASFFINFIYFRIIIFIFPIFIFNGIIRNI